MKNKTIILGRFKKLLFPIMGLAALIWFLIRVIPKPSRASYPCMRASMPLASSIVLYIIGLTASMFMFKKARTFLLKAKYPLFGITLLAAIIISIVTIGLNNQKTFAKSMTNANFLANEPIGKGVGVFPGRVVWIHNKDATNKNCTNNKGDYWFMDKNTNQKIVNTMLSEALQGFTEETSDIDAWDAIFKYHNSKHGQGEKGYSKGEKIVVKVNMNAIWLGDNGINTSPQICYALLDQLINVVGVAQSDISIGDPNCSMTDATYIKCHTAFPKVTYWGTGTGKTKAVAHNDAISWSDGSGSDPLPQSYVDAEYMINVPVIKKHHRSGITLAAKNHFGSVAPFTDGASHLHHSLPCPTASGSATNGNYGVYRCFVDIMGHKHLGDKTILYLVDAVWGSTNWGHPPIKWRKTPFNNDWPNSIFVSQDPVAVESVALDFLLNEFDVNHPTEGSPANKDKGPFPHFAGTDDYLRQAADSSLWPPDFSYDPENDGIPIRGSLGAHEHWNNPAEKLYSRNLGLDKGIELVSKYTTPSVGILEVPIKNQVCSLEKIFPNPFSGSTTIQYTINSPSKITLIIFDINGKIIKTLIDTEQPAGSYKEIWNGKASNGLSMPSGTYVVKLIALFNGQVDEFSKTITLSN
jgi:hypothetical protein